MSGFNFPLFNAIMNGLGFTFLLFGAVFVKQGKVNLHRLMMGMALLSSAMFLTSYLIYHFNVGHVVYQGAHRVFYFMILISHTVLSVALLPLLFLTLFNIFKGNVEAHKRWVRFTLPVWMYVSVTGVMIYFFNA